MADYQPARVAGRTAEISKDAGLQSHMTKVYGLMAVAMVITGLVAYAVGTSQTMLCLLYTSPSPRDGLLGRMPSSA